MPAIEQMRSAVLERERRVEFLQPEVYAACAIAEALTRIADEMCRKTDQAAHVAEALIRGALQEP